MIFGLSLEEYPIKNCAKSFTQEKVILHSLGKKIFYKIV